MLPALPPFWQPTKAPARENLEGRTVRLEPLDVVRHGDELFAEFQGPGSDPKLWDYLSVGPFPDRADFQTWLETIAKSADPLYFTIVDPQTNQPLGLISYLNIAPANGSIEIGWVMYGAAMQRTTAATETIYLMARHAFDTLKYRRLEWKCDSLNARSRAAADRFGFEYEGLFRQHMVIKGRNRDTAWFSIIDGDWQKLRDRYEAWLSPDNFDADGRQRQAFETGRLDRREWAKYAIDFGGCDQDQGEADLRIIPGRGNYFEDKGRIFGVYVEVKLGVVNSGFQFYDYIDIECLHLILAVLRGEQREGIAPGDWLHLEFRHRDDGMLLVHGSITFSCTRDYSVEALLAADASDFQPNTGRFRRIDSFSQFAFLLDAEQIAKSRAQIEALLAFVKEQEEQERALNAGTN